MLKSNMDIKNKNFKSVNKSKLKKNPQAYSEEEGKQSYIWIQISADYVQAKLSAQHALLTWKEWP